METPTTSPTSFRSLRRGINYLGALGAKLRDLQGFATLAFELIQNADDAPGATQITFDVSDYGVVVENDGQFSDCGIAEEPDCLWPKKPSYGHMCDFHRFREVSSGDKREQSETAGAFGVGFSAVYQITDRPELVSNGRHWLIYEDNPDSERILVCPGCVRCSDRSFRGTRFYLPWALDPNSKLRQALRAPAVLLDAKQRLIEELRGSIPQAMLFLKQLNRVEVFESRRSVLRFERAVVDSSVLINDGEHDSIWHIVSTDFDTAAAALRAKWGERIEKKRTARVRLALPMDAVRAGLLCAYLPTQQETGLPFHINADFFTQSDRKTVILESDYQSEWNRTALNAAADALTASLSGLPQWLGGERTWQIIDAVHTAYIEAREGHRDSVFQVFWQKIEEVLPSAKIAECTDGDFVSPSQVVMTQDTDELDAVPVLTAIGLRILRFELRQFAFHLPPLGRRIQIENSEAFAPKVMPGSMDYRPAVPKGSPRNYEVVGVAGDVANDLVINKRRPAVYFPLRSADVSSPSLQGVTLLVRATPGSNILELLRGEISAVDANAVLFDTRCMNEHIADFIAPLRSAAWTYGIIGIFGMVLASVGLAGMTAYSVVQRRREIGIRMALGARKGDVVRTVMKQGMLLIGIGTTIGLGCAWAGSRMLSAMNSSVGQVTATRASDPIVLFGAPLLLGSVALLACYLPARKSSRVDPLLVLREE